MSATATASLLLQDIDSIKRPGVTASSLFADKDRSEKCCSVLQRFKVLYQNIHNENQHGVSEGGLAKLISSIVRHTASPLSAILEDVDHDHPSSYNRELAGVMACHALDQASLYLKHMANASSQSSVDEPNDFGGYFTSTCAEVFGGELDAIRESEELLVEKGFGLLLDCISCGQGLYGCDDHKVLRDSMGVAEKALKKSVGLSLGQENGGKSKGTGQNTTEKSKQSSDDEATASPTKKPNKAKITTNKKKGLTTPKAGDAERSAKKSKKRKTPKEKGKALGTGKKKQKGK